MVVAVVVVGVALALSLAIYRLSCAPTFDEFETDTIGRHKSPLDHCILCSNISMADQLPM